MLSYTFINKSFSGERHEGPFCVFFCWGGGGGWSWPLKFNTEDFVIGSCPFCNSKTVSDNFLTLNVTCVNECKNCNFGLYVFGLMALMN